MNTSPPKDQSILLLHQALACHQQGRTEEALAKYLQVLAVQPANFDTLYGIGMLYAQQGRLEEALQFFTQACAARPDDFSIHFNQGVALHQLKRFEQALLSYDRSLSLQPGFVEAHLSRGNALYDLGRYDEATAGYEKVIALAPASMQAAQAFNNIGVILELQRRDHEALASYDRAIALSPGFAKAHNARSVLLERLGRNDAALAGYERAIAADRMFAEPYFNRANLLKALNRWDEALADYDRAIALKPAFAAAHNNRAILLALLHRYEEAVAAYDQALAADPDYVEVYYNKSLILLLLGDYPQGWRLYEWRWKSELKDAQLVFEQPLWLGDRPVAGRTLLLHAEQGMGDTIQMARYAPMVQALGARVILALPPELIPLLRTLKDEFTLVPRGQALPDFDLYCPMMSLPLAFKTTVETIPAPVPYLAADPQRQAAWRARLGPKGKARVGLVWSGNPGYKNDRHRSIPLGSLSPLLGLDFEFHSLQKQVKPEDRQALAELPQLHVHENELGDFADTAALIAELDIVISVDTAVAHLAGALGKPVWILLPHDPDFRWMTERNDSPWYPTARLFRQRRRGQWREVMEEVCNALAVEL